MILVYDKTNFGILMKKNSFIGFLGMGVFPIFNVCFGYKI